MDEFVETHSLKNCTTNIFNDTTIEEGILNFSDIVDADIISMTTHGRTGISHLLNGSLAEDTVNHSIRPVLSVRIPGKAYA